MNFELTDQQKEALNRTKRWWKTQYKQLWEISGAAGTGKTTIVYFLINEIGLRHDEVLFMAYVGKATLALARKGNFAQTIHSTIYDVVYEDTNIPVRSELEYNRIEKKIKFVKKERLPNNIKLLVVDEAAMVSEKIAMDILSFGIPVITLGDNNQLDPVFGERYFLKKPDVVLTEPMRQSLDSPIIYLSQLAMKGKFIKYGNYNNQCYVIKKEDITDDMLTKSDIVICGTNKTRHNLNNYIRGDILGIHKPYPVINDKLICRRNNWNLSIMNNIYLINGMVGYVKDVYLDTYDKRTITIDFRPDFSEEEYFSKIKIDYNHLINNNSKNKFSRYNTANTFEFGYAITTYASQGTDWDNVFVYDEGYGTMDFRRKSLYTAITRAKKQLILSI